MVLCADARMAGLSPTAHSELTEVTFQTALVVVRLVVALFMVTFKKEHRPVVVLVECMSVDSINYNNYVVVR